MEKRGDFHEEVVVRLNSGDDDDDKARAAARGQASAAAGTRRPRAADGEAGTPSAKRARGGKA